MVCNGTSLLQIIAHILKHILVASIKVRTHNAKDADRRPFCVGWGTRRFEARGLSPLIDLRRGGKQRMAQSFC